MWVLSKAVRIATYRVVTQRSRQSSRRRAAKSNTRKRRACYELGLMLRHLGTCMYLDGSIIITLDVVGEDVSHATARDQPC